MRYVIMIKGHVLYHHRKKIYIYICCEIELFSISRNTQRLMA